MATKEELLESAMEYAKRGWYVLPLHYPSRGKCSCGHSDCKSPGKHPITAHGAKEATKSILQIMTWWGTAPYNIGVELQRSGLVEIDQDQHDEQINGVLSWEAKCKEIGIASNGSLQILSGRGIKTLYGRPSEEFPNINDFAPGVEIRTQGYAIVPPSLHINGKTYLWEVTHHPDEMFLEPLPGKLLEYIRRPKTEVARPAFVAKDSIPEGQRDNELTRIAGLLRRGGLSEEEIYNSLVNINKNRCIPPLDDASLHRISRSIGTKPAPVVQLPEEPVIMSEQTLWDKKLPEIKWIVPGLIREGLSILAGKPKRGKTFMALGLTHAIACGGKAFGQIDVEAGSCLYLALEDNERSLQDRLKKTQEAPMSKFFVTTEYPRIDQGGADYLHTWIKDHPDTRLVVVDTFARMKTPSTRQNDYYEDYANMIPFKSIADEFGIGMLLIHHLRKAESDDPLDLVSGTTGITGAADTILILKREGGCFDATLYLTGRGIMEQEIAMDFDPTFLSWAIIGDANDYKVSKERREILDVLKESETPMSPKEIAACIGKNEQAVSFLLFKMHKQEAVKKGSYGKYELFS